MNTYQVKQITGANAMQKNSKLKKGGNHIGG